MMRQENAVSTGLTFQEICPDFDEWPDRWQIMSEDRPYGRELLTIFKPFCEDLVAKGFSKSTIKRHLGFLWVLGGELIEEINEYEGKRTRPAMDLLMDQLDPDGGPYCRHLEGESEHRAFDATCKKLYKFLQESQAKDREAGAPSGYDTSWDLVLDEKGNRPTNEAAYDEKSREWQWRDWKKWLEENLVFPFDVIRKEDDDDSIEIAANEPFSVGHQMTAFGLAGEMGGYGIIARVKERRRKGHAPLCDLEVTPPGDRNFWPVREYVVWLANR